MPQTLPAQHDRDLSTRLGPGVDAARRLSPRTVALLAEHPHARRLVHSVWTILTTLERSGQYPGAIVALRRILTQHQPTAAGRCRTCRRVAWRRRPFPCAVWHQIRFDLLGLVAGLRLSPGRRHARVILRRSG
ncbi:MAG: hypothetical protein ACRDRS_23425 [Pseudonocardiaceae bacterium]